MSLRFKFQQSLFLGWKDFCLFWTVRSWILGWGTRTFCACLGFVLLAEAAGRPDATRSLVLGYALYAGCSATLWVVPASTWVRSEGMLHALMAAPSGLFLCTLGRGLIWVANGVATSMAVLMVAIAYFGIKVDVLAIGTYLTIFTAVALSTYGFAVFWGLCALFIPPLRNVIGTSLGVAIFACSGAVVPVTFWPAGVALVAHALPGFHASPLLKIGDGARLAVGVASELAVGGGWLLLALVMARYIDKWARRSGTIQE